MTAEIELEDYFVEAVVGVMEEVEMAKVEVKEFPAVAVKEIALEMAPPEMAPPEAPPEVALVAKATVTVKEYCLEVGILHLERDPQPVEVSQDWDLYFPYLEPLREVLSHWHSGESHL